MRSLWYIFYYNSGSFTVTAYYASGPDDPPGMLLIEEEAIGGSGFSVFASRPLSWSPSLTTTSTGAQTSANDNRPHAASYSDIEEPEAFPLTQWLPIAPKGVNVLRGVPFRDKLYCFAENGKVYSVSGPAPYRVDELDGSTNLICPDSVIVHSNQVFALTEQGVGILTDAGFRIISKGIEDDLLDALALTPAAVKRYGFGVSYESERQYQLWLPTSNSDTCAKVGFVYNSLDNTWAKWTGNRTWGCVSRYDGRLYMGEGAANKLRQERKTLDRTDFCDEALPVTISSSSGTTVTLASTTGVAAGDMLWQSAAVKSLVTEVLSSTQVKVASTEPWAAGSASVLVAIDVAVKWAPLAPDGPKAQKCFRETHFHFREFLCRAFQATYDTEVEVVPATATLTAANSYGSGAYGTPSYGNPLGLRNRKVEVTPGHHSAAMVRVGCHIREAYALWALHGFTVDYESSALAGRK
jgi:hypothetical protein